MTRPRILCKNDGREFVHRDGKPARARMTFFNLEVRSTYSGFRKFQVSTAEQIKIPD